MRKAQIAMETIMIYGLAVLIVTLAVGALVYFGVLDFGRLLPDKCITGNQIACENFVVQDDGSIKLELRNRVGKVVNVESVDIYGVEDWDGILSCSYNATTSMGNGDMDLFEFTDCGTLDKTGQKIKANILIGYKVGQSEITQKITGELQATVAE